MANLNITRLDDNRPLVTVTNVRMPNGELRDYAAIGRQGFADIFARIRMDVILMRERLKQGRKYNGTSANPGVLFGRTL